MQRQAWKCVSHACCSQEEVGGGGGFSGRGRLEVAFCPTLSPTDATSACIKYDQLAQFVPVIFIKHRNWLGGQIPLYSAQDIDDLGTECVQGLILPSVCGAVRRPACTSSVTPCSTWSQPFRTSTSRLGQSNISLPSTLVSHLFNGFILWK